MNKKFLLPFLVLPLLAGCGKDKDPGSDEHVHTFDTTTWTCTETTHYHAATCEHTDLKADEEYHDFENGYCVVCNYKDPEYVDPTVIPDPVAGTWSATEKALFASHLYGYEVPNLQGYSVQWDETNLCLYITGVECSEEFFTSYVNLIASQGFSKENGPYPNSYILVKDVIYEESLKTIELDAYLVNGIINIVCYDPYLYEWPQNIVDLLFDEYFYIAPEVEIPSANADRYLLDTSLVERSAALSIYCFTNVNLEESYALALEENGLIVSKSKNEFGYYSAEDNKQLVDVFFKYDLASKVFLITIQKCNSWPAFVVDYYLNQLKNSGSNTTIPRVVGADTYEFIEASFDAHGYFFVLCEMDQNYEATYAQDLDVQYTVYNEAVNAAGNYWAISDNNDILVQYKYIVTESIMGGEPYKHFDVLFEKYYPHDEAYVNEQIKLIQPGSETTLPAFPGYGEKVTMSEHNVYLFLDIQAATFNSINEYAEILTNAGWDVKEESKLLGNYVAVSPDRDIKLETSFQSGRPELKIYAYRDEYNTWPTEGVDEILSTLGLKGEVPEFENAYGFDYENNNLYHDIVCIVKSGNEAELVEAYYKKLIDLGWSKIVDGKNIYYVKPGDNVAISAYYERIGSGYVFIDIGYGDGTIYDIDVRTAFIDWKNSSEIVTNVNIPGINLTEFEIEQIVLCKDEGTVYEGMTLFEILVDLSSGNIPLAAASVKSQFENAGWEYSSSDGYYHKENFMMTAYEYEGYLAIDLFTEIPDKGLLGMINKFVYDVDLYQLVPLPTKMKIVGSYEMETVTYEIDYVNLTLNLTFEDAEKAAAAVTVIKNAFISAGWEKSSSNPESYVNDSWLASLKLLVSAAEGSNVVTFILKDPYSA